jgi:hypothetical protein
MNTLSREEAREALADIDHIARRMRRSVGTGPMGWNLVVWGLVWMLAFSLSYWFPGRDGRIWGVLNSAGLCATAVTVFLHRRDAFVRSEEEHKVGLQILQFWSAVIGFALVLGLTLGFRNPADQMVFFVTIMMLAYVLMGIWVKSPVLCGIGLVVTAATLAGRAWLPQGPFHLWMAFFGGGGLLFPGLYVLLRWK